MYAYEISKNLKEKFGFTTALITVYVVLYKMIREELIQVREEKKIFGRPNRKYYEITARGKEAFLNGRNFLVNVLKKLS